MNDSFGKLQHLLYLYKSEFDINNSKSLLWNTIEYILYYLIEITANCSYEIICKLFLFNIAVVTPFPAIFSPINSPL